MIQIKKIEDGACNSNFVKGKFELSQKNFITDMRRIFEQYTSKSDTLRACKKVFEKEINKIKKWNVQSKNLKLLLENFGEYYE